MISIRNGLFETNSSSTHSICISNNKPEKFPEKLVFKVGEYGWEENILRSTEALASYLYTAILEFYYNNEKEKSDYLNYIYESLGSVGCDCEFVEPETNNYGYMEGYIDHFNMLGDFIKDIRHSKNRLLKYLFSEDSFIITGNDNNDWYYDYRDKLDLLNFEEYKKGN